MRETIHFQGPTTGYPMYIAEREHGCVVLLAEDPGGPAPDADDLAECKLLNEAVEEIDDIYQAAKLLRRRYGVYL